MVEQKPPDEPARTPEEEAKEGAFLATDWFRIALVIIGLVAITLGLMFTTGLI